MDLHLTHLQAMHPTLSLTTALEYEYRAAVGLTRHGHAPGVHLAISLDGQRRRYQLYWGEISQDADVQLDFHRITEDAAEAVAIALVHIGFGWTILRRLQRREAGDWLLVDAAENQIAMEVSGVDGIDTRQRRLNEKLQQVRRSNIRGGKAACVVELTPPRARLKTA
jgi:hypothetical protein